MTTQAQIKPDTICTLQEIKSALLPPDDAFIKANPNYIYLSAHLTEQAHLLPVNESLTGYYRKYYVVPPELVGVKKTLFVKFTIEKDGSLTDLQILRDAGYGSRQAAIDMFKKMPKWSPAKIRETVVRTQITLPIRMNQ